MGLRINQNIAAQNAYRSLSVSDNQMSKSLEKLSSGFRINRAADDAAGLAISEGLRSQVGGLKVAVRNAQDGVSVVQTAEGALNEVHSILQRMRDLGVQAGNDSNNAEARANIATEVNSLTEELDRIGSSTNFNGTKLLDGSANGNGKLTFQVGADGNANSEITVDLSGANIKSMVGDLKSAVVPGGLTKDIDTTKLDNNTYTFKSVNGANTTQVDVTATGLSSANTIDEAVAAFNANADFAAHFSASVTKDPSTGNSMGIQIRANDGGTVTATHGNGAFTAATPGVGAGLSFVDHDAAQESVKAIDAKIKAVSTARANLGAYQNRFEHTINNTNVAIENLSASESRIRDTDMAQEMMSYTRSQILTQAGTAMLSQANQSQQGVLSLLR
ncbi:flagellin [Actinoplanes sp. NPDC049548]|uniref:flagellin N-terminal helical domain-containing protein n=1 Tax=Actinoplanes sp. NPDC049548 TaxID=3155152 RepID=UPI00343BFAEA